MPRPMTPVPPVTRADGSVVELRMLRARDRRDWESLRSVNAAWLREWEATSPEPVPYQLSFRQLVRWFDKETDVGRMLPYAISANGVLVGQMHLFGIAWGSTRSGAAGYWVSKSVAGQGIAPLALAMLCDHAFETLALHRVEVNIRPDNVASLRVVAKLGFRDEGLRARYLHINGDWHDHRTFALTSEDTMARRMVARLMQVQPAPERRHTEAGPR